MNVNKKYLTAKEAAEYLGLTMQGIWKLAFNKKVRYYSVVEYIELLEAYERGRLLELLTTPAITYSEC